MTSARVPGGNPRAASATTAGPASGRASAAVAVSGSPVERPHLDSIRPSGSALSDTILRAADQLESSTPSAWRR